MPQRFTVIWKNVLWFINLILSAIAPLCIILFLVGTFALLNNYGTDYRFKRQMTEEGQTAVAVIDSVSRENNRISVNYSDDQDNLRYGVLEMWYYDPVLWETLTPDTSVQIRYLPVHTSGNDRVVLQQYFDDVLSYHGYLFTDLGIMLGAWLLIIAKPRCLYLGFIEFEELFKELQP